MPSSTLRRISPRAWPGNGHSRLDEMQRRSRLSIQFLGLFSTALYRVVLAVVLLSGLAILHRGFETVLALKIHRLREPSEVELRKLGPAWWAVCTAAASTRTRTGCGFAKARRRLRRSPTGTRSRVELDRLHAPQHNLEAILAHELAHHMALPRRVSLFLFWLSLPARAMGWGIVNGLNPRSAHRRPAVDRRTDARCVRTQLRHPVRQLHRHDAVGVGLAAVDAVAVARANSTPSGPLPMETTRLRWLEK
ncbi:hypothetical protein [Kribbella sp. CA-293567]|uniref:hypothetical protein n=1 Tax=Kribbella sp. CA-293567 TaxID=3002436 RepID=UPI0022DD2A01|nr:hypothetical protein [Kribbella sp. CA-293567]WBQ04339.1 hypothetical protein OX958_30780 [Kribbella sp. CA-293567]